MLEQILFTFFASIAFAALFNTPKRVWWQCGIVGMVGYAVFLYLRDNMGVSSQISNFLAAVSLAVLSELFARVFKEPVTIFSAPGIIPLVPGLPMYQGMSFLLAHAYNAGIDKLVQAALDAAAIALGIMLISSMARLCKGSKANLLKMKV